MSLQIQKTRRDGEQTIAKVMSRQLKKMLKLRGSTLGNLPAWLILKLSRGGYCQILTNVTFPQWILQEYKLLL